MPADRVLVVDAGTSALRAVAVSFDGDVSTVATEPWPLFVPDDAAPFGREFEVEALGRCLTTLLGSAGTGDFAAVGLTGQREGLVFADENNAAIYAGPNIDARASAEGIEIDAAHAAGVYAVTGHLPSLMQPPAKLVWLRRHRPDDAARVRSAQPFADWLAGTLTGQPAISSSLAAENGLLDVRSGAVCADHLGRLDFDPELVPPIRQDGLVAGSVASGRFAGTPVVLAGADTQCALVGLGAVRPGMCGVPAGWSAPLQLVTTQPLFDTQMRTWTSRHVVTDHFVLESNAGEMGRAWQWVCDLLGVAASDAACLAATSPAGANDLMWVLCPRTMFAAAMNAGTGALAFPLPLVMSSPSRGDVLRSVLESIAFAIRANLEQLEEVAAERIPSLRLGGGMSRSPLFAQIVADVLDRPIEVAHTPETSALGAAALAAVAVGAFPSLDAALEKVCRARTIFEPQMRVSAEYEDYYARWSDLAGGAR